VISVLIPVKDGGEDLRRCLAGIHAQRLEDEVEIVVVDSGSCDGSVALARSAGARVHEIAPSEFNHGATRNLAAELARGEILVFTSQDAYARDEDWLAALIAPLAQDGSLAGAYGRQIAHAEATPPERFFMDFLYGERARTQRAAGVHELSMQTTLFSNVNSAIRADVFARFAFVDDIIMSEDQEWSRRVLLAGYALRYVPEAAVHHSHPYTLRQAFRRFFDSGVSSERAYMAGAAPSSAVLRRQARRYAREELAWLWQSGRRRWIPYSAAYEAAKFAGLQLGIHHARLPHAVKVRCSALPGYWASQGGR
jgi:rhamnosyltransferase